MKTTPSTSSSPARHRGNYTSRACFACQQKKKKCEVIFDVQEGVRRDCERCVAANIECSWVGKKHKPLYSASLVEKLKSRIKSLENQLANCNCPQNPTSKGGYVTDESPITISPSVPSTEGAWIDTSTSIPGDSSDEEPNIDELLVPTTHLILNDETDYLQQWGPCSIFRLAPNHPRTFRFPDIVENSDQAYVLQVDDVDSAQCRPNFDWSRHLPSEVFMDRREHDKLLDLLFKFFTCWCLRIVPPLFLRDMCRALSPMGSRPPPKTPHYSPMLHNALLALAMSFSDDPRMRDLSTRLFFVRKAKSYIEVECQRPSISFIHALSTLSSFHIAQGDQTLGYVYFGMSSQISQALGLNIECSQWVKAFRIRHDDMLDRNWAYWTTFCQDVCLSFYVGRRGVIPLPSDQSNLPIPFVDSEYDEIPWHYPPSKIPPRPNYLSHTFAETCEILKIARQIMDFLQDLRSRSSGREIYEIITNIDGQLRAWKECLSAEVDITPINMGYALPHCLMLHLTYWWLYILLHRPFYRREPLVRSPQWNTGHAGICNDAAAQIMELLNTWRSSYTLRFVPISLMQVVFSTGTIFLLAAKPSTSSESNDVVPTINHPQSQARLCIQYLNEISQSWNCANSIRDILEYWLRRSEGTSEPETSERTAGSMDVPLPYEGYQQQPSTSDQFPLFSGDPLTQDFDFGSQPYDIDQFTDSFGGSTSYGIDDSMVPRFLPPSSGMPGGHALSNHPIMHFDPGVGYPMSSHSRYPTDGIDPAQSFERYIWSTSQPP